MKIGGHVSTAGGLATAFDRALDIGAETIQIFASPPQQWRSSRITPEEAAQFRARMAETGVSPVFVHGAYLINLASSDDLLLRRSTGSLRSCLHFCSQVGAVGCIFHIGSHKGSGFENRVEQVARLLREVAADTPEDALIILENSAGQGGAVGSKFAELGEIMRRTGSPRVKVCLDTQHSYAAGYDLATPEGIAAAMEEFGREVGFENVVAVHANDSKIPLGGGVDRHENIGDGHIGIAGFEVIMGHPAFRDVPFLLEVPGLEKKGPDRANVDALKALRARLAATPG